MYQPKFRRLTLSLSLISLLTACGPSPTTPSPSASPAASLNSMSAATGTSYSADASSATTPRPTASAVPTSAPTAAATSAPSSAGDSTPMPMPSATASSASDISVTPTAAPTVSPVSADQARSGLLTAGAWSDLENWEFWRGLMQKPEWSKMLTYWGMSPLQRISIQAQSAERPAVDQLLFLKDVQGATIAQARSNNRGQADFFVSLFENQTGPFSVTSADGETRLDNLEPSTQARVLDLNAAKTAANNADLMLVVDTTGSMGDELDYLKVEMRNVLDRVSRENSQLKLRASVNFYRDNGDEYVVRDFPFSSDFNQIQSQLSAQLAGGGGDAPEAVVDALENAIDKHQWSDSARARLVFLVLDAPPHYDSRELVRLRQLIERANKAGVRILPVASSGVDKETEFLMRMLAITTGGEYVFLTNDSGIGGDHIEPTIGEHKVEKLNDLMVRLVGKYTR